MLKTLACLCTALLMGTSTAVSTNNFTSFVTGIAKGLETEHVTGKCGARTLATIEHATHTLNLAADVWAGDLTQFAELGNALRALYAEGRGLTVECDFTELLRRLEAVLSHSGYFILARNYFKNSVKLIEDLAVLRHCTTNYTECGVSAGEVFRLMTDWKLNGRLIETVNFDIFEGLLTGLSCGVTSECRTGMIRLEPDIEGVLETAKKVTHGNIFMVRTLIDQVLRLQQQVTSYYHDCNGAGLSTLLEELLTKEGVDRVVAAYLKDSERIHTDFKCQDSQCGVKVGTGLKLLAGWCIN